MPDAKFQRPRLSYILAHRYRKQLRCAEAAEEYLKIIQYYPEEQAPYIELVALAGHHRDERMAAKYTRLFEQRFRQSISPHLESSLLGNT